MDKNKCASKGNKQVKSAGRPPKSYPPTIPDTPENVARALFGLKSIPNAPDNTQDN